MKEIKTEVAIVRIHSPEITKEESRRRMKQIQKAAEDLLKSYGRRARA